MIDTPFQFNAGRIMVRRAKTIHRAKACSHAKAWRVVAAVTAAGMLAGLACAPAQAQGKLDARYTASLAGLKLGSGAWVVDVTDKQYTSAASGSASGLMRVFSSGQGTGAVRGAVVNGLLVAGTYASTINTNKKTDEVRILINAGVVKQYTVTPPQTPDPERVPVTAKDRNGVMDPMTAWLIRSPGTGNPVSAAACEQKLPVFDGRMRYNLTLAYKRMDRVKAKKGYAGPVVVCSLYFSPVSGHIPNRVALKYLEAQRDMELWLAPIAGTRLLVPFRASVPTPLGEARLEATQFVTVAGPQHASATTATDVR
jgi:hypothetical protein